jgi:hypothetical protein
VVRLADLVKEVRDPSRAVVVHSTKYAGSVLGTATKLLLSAVTFTIKATDPSSHPCAPGRRHRAPPSAMRKSKR